MSALLHVAGVDEAGRGPLAGPVVCAAVILDPDKPIYGLGDSKVLSKTERERLFDIIQADALAWRVEFVSSRTIDRLNIFHATMEGMRLAVCGLSVSAGKALIDGNKIPPGLPCPAEALVKGDAREPAIMAASILAKVSRDRHLLTLHTRYPGYGFDQHKGYPTPVHLQQLAALGPCPEHRRSFRPVRERLSVLLADSCLPLDLTRA